MSRISRPVMVCFICLFCLPHIYGCAGHATKATDAGYVDAVEVKLKCRELADQMLATMPNDALQGLVAMPTSFVDQNNTERTSPLGRLMSESMFYEFNQRGFPTREYRLTGHISVRGGRDDLSLIANQTVPTGQKWAALLVGTYYVDKDATFVNVRLVRATDGLVLRTGQLVLVNTPIILRMAQSYPARPASSAGTSARTSTAGSSSAGSSVGSSQSKNTAKPVNADCRQYPGLYAPRTPASQISSGSMRIRQGR